jgi:hypothetical protein
MAYALPKITLAVFLSIIRPSFGKGVKVRAADVEIGRSGVEYVVEGGSNASKREAEMRTVQACIVAAIGILEREVVRSTGGASANKRWILEGRPHFSITMEDFRKAVPGGSHVGSGWHSKRKSLAGCGVDIYSVSIVRGDGGHLVHFVPC